MQVVHYIPHPRYKITVFRSGNRYVVKFDDADHDLAFKFREGEVNNLQDIGTGHQIGVNADQVRLEIKQVFF